MLKSFFGTGISQRGRATFLTHGTIVEEYKKPILTELGSILNLTEGSEKLSADDGATGYIYSGNEPSGGNDG